MLQERDKTPGLSEELVASGGLGCRAGEYLGQVPQLESEALLFKPLKERGNGINEACAIEFELDGYFEVP